MKRTLTVMTAAVAVLLTGCAAATGVDQASPPDSAVVAASQPDAWPELPDGVLATGTFEGAAHGEVQILNLGDGMFTLRIDGLSIGFDRNDGITAVPYSTYPAEDCGSVQGITWGFGYEHEGVVPEKYETVVPLEGFAGDPSLIRELIIRDMDAPEWYDECSAAPAAKAVLDWTYEPLRASLVAVDEGSTGGARGETSSADGVIVAYTVASNDLIDEVAARFGMTADDIRYLNPLLGHKLTVDETIVLNGAYR